MALRKIVSGAQTGVDRGALDAALRAGFPCGGWCPEARKAEDGAIPQRYPVVELAGAGYRHRTRQNVIDADGTLVIYLGTPSGGTRETMRFCVQHRKPLLALNAREHSPAGVARAAASFVRHGAIETLNVAGPRESSWHGARAYAEEAVAALIAVMGDG